MDVILEFCQNHNGKKDVLERMLDEAAELGVKYVKLQAAYADDISFRPEFENGLEKDSQIVTIKRPYKEEYDRLKNLELSDEVLMWFVDKSNSLDMTPMITCFSRNRINQIFDCGFKSIKVASYDCASYTMIRELINKFEEIIISTGATFDNEIEHVANQLQGTNFTFLHCVTMYPTPLQHANLKRMNFLKNFTDNVGYSDHSIAGPDNILTSIIACHIGADIIEKHYTVLDQDETRDGKVSSNKSNIEEINQFSKLSHSDQRIYLDEKYPLWMDALGTEKRLLTKEELLNRAYYRGRFYNPRKDDASGQNGIFNWEETGLA